MTTVLCPRVSGEVREFGERHPSKYSECELLQLRQFWLGPDRMPAEQGVGNVGFSEEHLSFYLWLEDSRIYTEVSQDNEQTWELGDTAEFFIKPGRSRSDHWEIHITPTDRIMDMHIFDRERFLSGETTWEEIVAASKSDSSKRAMIGNDKKSWAVELFVPWSAFGCE